MIAFVAPILPGKTSNWKKFINELNGDRSKEFIQSRKNLDLHERTYFQTTPNGDFVIVTLEGKNPEESFNTFVNSTEPFAKWFMSNVKEIHGMEMNNLPAMPTMILDTESTTKTPAYTSL